MTIYKDSPVWQMSAEALVKHLGEIEAPDRVYWDSRQLKNEGSKFTKMAWTHWRNCVKSDGAWIFMATHANQPVKPIKPNWAVISDDGATSKISIGGESFWLTVVSHDRATNEVVATVDNNLVCTDEHGLSCGNTVRYCLTVGEVSAPAAQFFKVTSAILSGATADQAREFGVRSQPKVADDSSVITELNKIRDCVGFWVVSGCSHPAPPAILKAKQDSGAGWAQLIRVCKAHFNGEAQ